jgi:hypothetical protein
LPVSEYLMNETRFKMVEKLDPEGYRKYAAGSQLRAERRMAVYRHISQLRLPTPDEGGVTANKEQTETGPQPPKEV